MQALPAGDARNWNKQASIHQNFCPHGNWFFLPWHRGYLLSFERIIRKLTGVADFALPYWNWSCNRAIPAPFWQAGSPLNHSPRWIGPSDQADASIVGPANIAAILNETDFELFASGFATALRGAGGSTGRLEGGPHNYIHGSFVGGTMASYMSPLDPIFWLHHNILDYLWLEWNSRGNANSNDPVYTGMQISGQFCDENGAPIEYNVGAMILAPLISYRFEAPHACPKLATKVDEAVLKKFLQQGARVRLQTTRAFPPAAQEVQLGGARAPRVQLSLAAEAARIGFDEKSPQRVLLRLDDVKQPVDENFYVRVFVGLPEGTDPSPDSPYYAGAFAFFADQGHHEGVGSTFLVDVSPTLARLRAEGRIQGDGNVPITLVTVPNAGKPRLAAAQIPPLSIGAVTPVLIPRMPKPQPLK
ncbi:tyrosinase family protein [Sphingomonas sp. JC676]|uniref:tyrosinase family protein n=1 Tax=Sphingomonas sp. JC676 TaxID=2768065 RepID=UPI001657CA64|nr:tyrosinase family protein [Sphingomonas sp. JC676]MBC9031049.1 tyrosinase family protein [Sphingomonas sp. JC676]